MAARDRNLFAWQAYVIAMSFVVVGLIVALGFSIAKQSNIAKSVEDATARARTADETTRKLTNQVELISGMLGQRQFTEAEWDQMKKSLPPDPQMEALQTQFQKDMSLFGPNEPIQNRNYPKLAETLMRELRDRNIQIDNANKTHAELVQKTENTVKSETAARDAAEKRATQLEKELENARIDFTAKIDEGQKTIASVSETLQKKIAEFAKEKAKLEAIVKEKTQRSEELVALNLKLNQRIREIASEEFQHPQGKIIDVADGGNIVWVNLGSGDGLRPGVKFGIISPDVTKLRDAKPKAHLEIAEVISRDQSRAKVISGNIQVPIIKGDLIYSTVWQKGRKTQFALLGKIDMNGDGLDDRQTLKELILQSGGEISEDLAPDGKSSGRMTVDTDWLVIGESFKVSATENLDPRQAEYRRKYADMQQRAKDLAVSQINLDKLLGWIQNAGDIEKTVPLGSGIRAVDFQDRRRVPSSLGTVSEIYQQRKTPAAFGRPTDGEATSP